MLTACQLGASSPTYYYRAPRPSLPGAQVFPGCLAVWALKGMAFPPNQVASRRKGGGGQMVRLQCPH